MLQFLMKLFRPVGASRLATSGAVARVTRVAVFSIFTTALFLRGLSPANECASEHRWPLQLSGLSARGV